MSCSVTSSPACSRRLVGHICCCLLSRCSGGDGSGDSGGIQGSWSLCECGCTSCLNNGMEWKISMCVAFLLCPRSYHDVPLSGSLPDKWFSLPQNPKRQNWRRYRTITSESWFFFCHIRAKIRAHSNLRELAFALYCSQLLSMLNVRANVLYFYPLCIPALPQPKTCFDVCCISRSVAESTKYKSSGLKIISSSQTIRKIRMTSLQPLALMRLLLSYLFLYLGIHIYL